METSFRISLNKKERERLGSLALRYGLSLPEFSRKILLEIEQIFLTDSFFEYDDPKELKNSLNRAVKDYTTGRVRTKL